MLSSSFQPMNKLSKRTRGLLSVAGKTPALGFCWLEKRRTACAGVCVDVFAWYAGDGGGLGIVLSLGAPYIWTESGSRRFLRLDVTQTHTHTH